MDDLLVVHGATKRFSGVLANNDISFRIREQEIVGLIGPNGAGKSTLFDCVTGFQSLDSGNVTFTGVDITNRPPSKIAKLGMVRSFQIPETLRGMTILESVMLGALCRTWSTGAAHGVSRSLLKVAGLEDRANVLLQDAPFAERKMAEVLRLAATRPKLMMLDEALSGLSPTEQLQAVELLRLIHSRLGVAILLVEHIMDVVMSLSDRVIVLNFGQKIAEGVPSDIARDPEVMEAYLGNVGTT